MYTSVFSASSRIAIAVVVGLAASGQVAFAVPQATTQVSKFCELRGGVAGFDQELNVMRPIAQHTSCDLSGGVLESTAAARGNASAGFGPGIPRVGSASTGVEISAFEAIAEAHFMASVGFAFEIRPLAPPPVTIADVPVVFGARASGSAERSGYGIGTALGTVHMSGNGLTTTDALFEYRIDVVDPTAFDPVDQEAKIGGFDVTRSFNLYPGSTYTVVLSTACSSWAGPVGQGALATIGCAASVAPVEIGFDQAAFGAAMGSSAFPLDQYYAFDFSANLPIPEPRTYALMLAGIALVWRRVRLTCTRT